jgi:multidrug efflux pump subunit AcrA (membrane-fusion protein)
MTGSVAVDVGAPHEAVVVPAAAVVYDAAEPVVFVEEGDGRYGMHAVRLGAVRDGRIEIASGLAPGARVVVAGAASLLSASRLPAEGGEE